MAKFHIALAGNMGVGKTEFTNQILKEPIKSYILNLFGGYNQASIQSNELIRCFQEKTYPKLLSKFYKDNKRWAFTSQMYYFAQRLKILKEIKDFSGIAIEDRTIFEDRLVFGQANYELGNMHDLEFDVYHMTYQQILNNFNPPDLLIYLRVKDVSILKTRIKQRGDPEEKDVPLDYFSKLNEKYETMYTDYKFPKMIVNAEIDCFEDSKFYENIVAEVIDKIKLLQ